MELCTTQSISTLPTNNHRFLAATNPNLGRTKTSLSLNQIAPHSCSAHGPLRSRFLYYTNKLPRATTSGETSGGANQYFGDKRDSVITVEEVPPTEKYIYSESVPTEVRKEELPADEQTNGLLDNLNIQFDSGDTYSIILYGAGALVTLWLASAIVGAIDSIPLFPKLMEVVGFGYTFWFSTRYLLFKKNREELRAKIEEIKQQVLGSNDD